VVRLIGCASVQLTDALLARAGWKSFALVQHNLVVAGVATVNTGAIATVSASLHNFLFKAAPVLDSSRSYLGWGLEVVCGWRKVSR
jgi:hypothetical protein